MFVKPGTNKHQELLLRTSPKGCKEPDKSVKMAVCLHDDPLLGLLLGVSRTHW